ncbi:MAG TPA: hypothetical protein VFI18_02595 [Gaiellales bacterium]|nr:hypothetical protein [Gaiellales bacterium]
MGDVTAGAERSLESLATALDWLDESYEDARQILIDGAVASAVVLTSLALLPYIDGGGLIAALAFIGLVQGLDLVARTGRGLADVVRRTPTRAVRE